MIPLLQKLHAAAKGRMFVPENFSGNDFSYRIGKAVFWIKDGSKALRRRTRRWFRSPVLARMRANLDRNIQRRDWTSTREQASALATLAEQVRDPRLMEDVGIIFATLGEYERSASLRLASRRLRRNKKPNDWQGGEVDGLLLVDFVENEGQGMGGTLKRGFLLRGITGLAAKSAAIVQPRLQPLFARTFPGIEIFSPGESRAREAQDRAAKIAGAEHLDFYIGRDAGTIRSLFSPLKPDAETVAAFRNAYRKERNPLVGISWGSSAYAKDVPKLGDWLGLLKHVDAQFVSLQYGKVGSEIEQLQSESGKRIISDPSVDQLKDMDRFAAQIAALDAVVTISNTGAHLAGALGVPMIVLNDDSFRKVWPIDAEHIPYYPAATVTAKRGRAWDVVIDEVELKLQDILAKRALS